MTSQPIRTLLFVPGDRPDRIRKAANSSADAIAVDLEDAVALSRKEKARQLAIETIRTLPMNRPRIYVRVNAADSGMMSEDIGALLSGITRVEGIILPMCETAEMIHQADECLTRLESRTGIARGSLRIIPLLETAAGVLDARTFLQESFRVRTATFGPADLSRQLGITPTAQGTELFTARSLLVLASAASGTTAPIDGPFLDLDDEIGLERSAQLARDLGFEGKQAIHPSQLETIATVFAPTQAQLAWALDVDRAFTEAEARGVTSLRLADGTFIDYPIALRARDIIARSAQANSR